jgi:hypothetical protein
MALSDKDRMSQTARTCLNVMRPETNSPEHIEEVSDFYSAGPCPSVLETFDPVSMVVVTMSRS